MDKTKSSAPGKFSNSAKPEQTSVRSRGLVSRGRINMQMMENVLVLWLDNNIDENSADYHNTIIQLRCAVNMINTFTDGEECIQFLENMDNDKACMIISDSLGQHIVPRVHNMSQVDSIFIFSHNKKYHEQWTKDWSKIQGIFAEISPICEALKEAVRQCERDAISISFMATNDDLSKKNLDQLEPSFMYSQVLQEILLTMDFKQEYFTKFIDYCRKVLNGDEIQLKNVTKLEQKYHNETPIWWYTFDCFLYRMLNRALRLMDVDIIIKMVFFIGDLHRHIEQLHKEQFGGQNSNKSFKVYRGQSMSKVDFEQLTKTKGGLISFNSFLSTSKDRDVSLGFARRALKNPDSVGILFIMVIDPSQSTTPFASTKTISHFQKEDEILFAMHTVFRIGDITPKDENHRLFQVKLTLTSDNDKDLCMLTDRTREETRELTGWDQLGEVLIKMGQPKKAQEFYEILLCQITTDNEKARIYHQIGKVKYYLAEYEEAIIWNENALKIRQQLLSPKHPDLAKSYNSIGVVYYRMGEYSKAVSSYEKALDISQQSLIPNHPDLAMSYNNIGLVYDNMGEYSKALSYYEKDLEISQQLLPPNHPDLAMSYNNIGVIYYNMGEYLKALSSHEKALKIRQKSLLPNHPDLAFSYNNIGAVYDEMGEYAKALSSYEKALEIKEQSLPPNHPDLATSYNNIGLLYADMGEYWKALSYYENELEISQQSLSPNHPDLAGCYNNIGNVYEEIGEYSNALSCHEKALEIQKQSLPPNHPDLAISYDHIGNVYSTMGEYSKALSFCKRAVDIGQQLLPSNHPHLQWYKNNLDRVEKKL